MNVAPASIEQVRRASNGAMVHISADAGGVAQELSRIHPGLKLRYSEAGGYWAVFYESEDKQDTYLIMTAQECDHRICERIRYTDQQGRSGYDFAKALESETLEARRRAHEHLRKHVEAHAEQAAHALRKDFGVKNRIFIPA